MLHVADTNTYIALVIRVMYNLTIRIATCEATCAMFFRLLLLPSLPTHPQTIYIRGSTMRVTFPRLLVDPSINWVGRQALAGYY